MRLSGRDTKLLFPYVFSTPDEDLRRTFSPLLLLYLRTTVSPCFQSNLAVSATQCKITLKCSSLVGKRYQQHDPEYNTQPMHSIIHSVNLLREARHHLAPQCYVNQWHNSWQRNSVSYFSLQKSTQSKQNASMIS